MKSFIDSNVLIYWTDNSNRADIVEKLLAADASISVQVLNEFTNVLIKKRALPLKQIRKWCDTLLEVCEIHELSVNTHTLALQLMAKYKFSFYDANIVAAAGLAECDVLFSEDMQDGLIVRFPDKNYFVDSKSVSIINVDLILSNDFNRVMNMCQHSVTFATLELTWQ